LMMTAGYFPLGSFLFVNITETDHSRIGKNSSSSTYER